jgi:hypothetical protein
MCADCQRGLFYPLALGDEVNFRLTYDGPLKAASQSSTRRIEKHGIRQVFHRQLLELHRAKDGFLDANLAFEEQSAMIGRGNVVFVPLVREKLNLVCDLDILFLRRENPGQLINDGGDLDNRIKVLFDALRVPSEVEIRGLETKKKVLLCLTENDKLITGFRVTTDRLLEPAKSESEEHNVQLVINVEVRATKLTEQNIAYFTHF